MKLFCALLASLALSGAAALASDSGELAIDNNGIIKYNGIKAGIVFFGENWKNWNQLWRKITADKNYPQRKNESYSLKGKFGPDKIFDLELDVKKEPGASWLYSAKLSSAAPVKTSALVLAFSLPAEAFNGRSVFIGEKEIKLDKKSSLKSRLHKSVKKLTIHAPMRKMEISGDFDIITQDERKFGGKGYSIRIMFNPSKGNISKSSLKARIDLKPYKTFPVNISKNANMSFKDEVPNDGKGGWTDQGANDMRALKRGAATYEGVTFNIADETKNNGKACLIFSGPQRSYFLKDTVIELPQGTPKADCLYFLHALAWTPRNNEVTGKATITYEDGSEDKFDVESGRDLADWWSAYGVENGLLAWRGKNSVSEVGLFLSKFRLAKKAARKIKLEGTGKAVWMIAALSLGEDVPFKKERSELITKSAGWVPFSHHLLAEKNSILDFSFLQDAPAGKHGKVVVRDGHFEFESLPGKHVRFYGANICNSANYQSKEDCEKLADQFAKMGYNSARIHHFDRALIAKKSKSSTQIDPEQMDRLDYLFYCMKKRGIYISIDLFTSRYVSQKDVPELGRWPYPDFKALVPVLDSAMNNWKEFARKLLTHKNPYTGLAWKDDPALYGICVLNEDNTYLRWSRKEDVRRLYRARFDKWLEAKGIKTEKQDEKSALFAKFLIEININMFKECKSFLRELGTKALLTDANVDDIKAAALLRENFDYVDNHMYWDIGRFVERHGKLPYGYSNVSAISKFAALPRELMATRIFGKPFVVTEFNYSYPNHFRAEGGALMGAYAALQDWDGVYRFAYSHADYKTQKPTFSKSLDIVSDPINLLSDKIGMLLFLRGDVMPAPSAVPCLYSEEMLKEPSVLNSDKSRAPLSYSALGLLTKIGLQNSSKPSFIKRDSATESAIKKALDIKKGIFASETGQIVLSQKENSFKVVTKLTECFAVPAGKEVKGEAVEVRNGGGFSVIAVSSMDGRQISESQRMLLFYLTDIQNSETKYRNKTHTILADWGRLPLLVRKDSAIIKIKKAGAANPTIWGVDMNGKRLEKIKLCSADKDSFTFNVSSEKYLAYELIK